jgi:hypothetical protein
MKITPTVTSGRIDLARVRSWLGFGLVAAGTLYWFADLARWLAPA